MSNDIVLFEKVIINGGKITAITKVNPNTIARYEGDTALDVSEVPQEVLDNYLEYEYRNNQFIKISPIEESREKVIQAMSAECEKQIVNGFYSDCLGVSLLFGCKKDEDQPWIIGLALSANVIKQIYSEAADTPNPKLSWKNQEASKCFSFTPNQMSKLGDDMQAHIQNKKNRFYDLRIWANDPARTIDELEGWTWDMQLPT